MIRITFFVLLLWMYSGALSLTLPNIPCNVTRGFFGARNRQDCAIDVSVFANLLNQTHGHEVTAPPSPNFRPAEFRIPKTQKILIYDGYGPEMPNFDDVIDTIQKAEDELERQVKAGEGAYPIERARGWNSGTARLSIINPKKYDGLTNRSLLQFLQGFWLSGTVYGFFEVHIVFYDGQLTESKRGSALLQLNAPR